MTNVRAWVRLPSGMRLDLLDPTPFDFADEDLALGLARTYRWGGHSAWPLPLSVAQHSLTVLALFREWQRGKKADPAKELRELLHDADEGLLGFDPISVIKPYLGPDFHALVARLQDAIFRRYGLVAWTDEEKKVHKKADVLAAASEALHVVGWTLDEIQHVLKIRYQPLAVDPLSAIYDCEPWQPWAPDVAAERFLAELLAIKQRGVTS